MIELSAKCDVCGKRSDAQPIPDPAKDLKIRDTVPSGWWFMQDDDTKVYCSRKCVQPAIEHLVASEMDRVAAATAGGGGFVTINIPRVGLSFGPDPDDPPGARLLQGRTR